MKPKFKKELDDYIRKFNGERVHGNGGASYETQHKRAEVLYGGFNELIHELGCKIESPKNIREYHMKRLAHLWEEKGIRDIQTRISVFRVFANVWLQKRGMIRGSERYVRNPETVRRQLATREDKSWTGKDVKVMEKIKQVAGIDTRVAIILELMFAFGLRLKEALLLRPHLADKKELLNVNRGSKGGKHRVTEKLATVRTDVLQSAKTFATRKTSSMIPDDRTFESYRKHLYRVCNRAQIGRKFGVVPHGLRHEYANEKYREITGGNSPIKGGAQGDVDSETDNYARSDIAENLGHHRPRISGAYLGAVLPQPQNAAAAASANSKQETKR